MYLLSGRSDGGGANKRREPASSGTLPERLENCRRPDRDVPHACADGCEDGVTYRRTDHRGAGLAEAYGHFGAGDEFDVHLWYVAHAQRRVGVEIRLLDLTIQKLSAFVQRQARSPERGAFS